MNLDKQENTPYNYAQVSHHIYTFYFSSLVLQKKKATDI